MNIQGEVVMKIFYCGKENCLPGHFFGPAVRPHFLIHFILDGQGSYLTGDREYQVKAGEAFLIRPGDVTYYEADQENPWSYAWIAFNGYEVQELLAERGLAEEQLIGRIRPDKWEMAERLLGDMVRQFEHACYDETELLGYFYLIMSCLVMIENQKQKRYDMDYFEKAVDYIRHNYSYPIHIQDIARHVGIDRTYLYRIFIQYEDISPKQYLTRYRLMVAKDMLENTSYRITEIAFSCGFHDASAFSRGFFREGQMSPQQYRKICCGYAMHS